MVKKISFIIRKDPALLNNNIFNNETIYGMKSDNYCFVALKNSFFKLGIEFSTYDIIPPHEADIIICLDEVNTFKQLKNIDKPSYLIISEPPVYTPENWNIKNHHLFSKVFTYNKDLITDKNYVFYTYSIDFKLANQFKTISEIEFKSRKLICLIAGAMQISKPEMQSKSLLYETYLAANYFSKYFKNEFSIYGRNLLNEKFEYFKGSRILKKMKLNSLIRLISNEKSKHVKKCYKGEIPALEKLVINNQFNFSICFENSSINGYITEKLFDCFFSKCVPIYFGAPNIKSYIPEDCFIDKNDFDNYNDLYFFIKNMNYSKYLSYLNAVDIFLKSKAVLQFTTSNYVNNIISNLELGK